MMLGMTVATFNQSEGKGFIYSLSFQFISNISSKKVITKQMIKTMIPETPIKAINLSVCILWTRVKLTSSTAKIQIMNQGFTYQSSSDYGATCTSILFSAVLNIINSAIQIPKLLIMTMNEEPALANCELNK